MKYLFLFLISFQAFAHNIGNDGGYFPHEEWRDDHEHFYTDAMKKIVADHAIEHHKIKDKIDTLYFGRDSKSPFEWIDHHDFIAMYYDRNWPILSRDMKTKKLIFCRRKRAGSSR